MGTRPPKAAEQCFTKGIRPPKAAGKFFGGILKKSDQIDLIILKPPLFKGGGSADSHGDFWKQGGGVNILT